MFIGKKKASVSTRRSGRYCAGYSFKNIIHSCLNVRDTFFCSSLMWQNYPWNFPNKLISVGSISQKTRQLKAKKVVRIEASCDGVETYTTFVCMDEHDESAQFFIFVQSLPVASWRLLEWIVVPSTIPIYIFTLTDNNI